MAGGTTNWGVGTPCTDKTEDKFSSSDNGGTSLAFNPRYYGDAGSGARFGIQMDDSGSGHPGTAWGIGVDIGSWGGYGPSSGSGSNRYVKTRGSEQTASGIINCCTNPKYFVASVFEVMS